MMVMFEIKGSISFVLVLVWITIAKPVSAQTPTTTLTAIAIIKTTPLPDKSYSNNDTNYKSLSDDQNPRKTARVVHEYSSKPSTSTVASLISRRNDQHLSVTVVNNITISKLLNDTGVNVGPKFVTSGNTTSPRYVPVGNANRENSNYKQQLDIHASTEINDGFENSSFMPSTNRSISSRAQTSAQDRERKLMNLLAARRSALHRTGIRHRFITTSRTAIESTSKSPTDPRSICIRNCTKNFTRRTTASCMRQCANFSRIPSVANTYNVTHTGNKLTISALLPEQPNNTTISESTNQERDTNEILFSDESSHRILVVAKEQNDTFNHIPETIKVLSGTQNHARSEMVTMTQSSLEDDGLKPYVYFGQKLPPLRPSLLAITAVGDEHPKLLEVSVAQLQTTPPTIHKPTPSLSAVERSRARFKYYMRDRGSSSFSRRNNITTRPPKITDNSDEVEIGTAKPNNRQHTISTSTGRTTKERVGVWAVKHIKNAFEIKDTITKAVSINRNDELSVNHEDRPKDVKPPSPPMIITVAGDDMISEDEIKQKMTLTQLVTEVNTNLPSMTSTVTTSHNLPLSIAVESTTLKAEFPNTTNVISINNSTSAQPEILSKSETELLRALGPTLTQTINTDDKSNLIIFFNKTDQTLPFESNPTLQSNSVDESYLTTTETHTAIIRPTLLSAIITIDQDNSISTTQKTFALHASTTDNSSANSIGSNDKNKINSDKRRMNIATMVLAGICLVPLFAIFIYVLRNFISRRHSKDDEDFDVCITDQQPISPVKNLESNMFNNENKEDERYDTSNQNDAHHQHQSIANQNVPKHLIRDFSYNHRCDDYGSVSSEQEFERNNIRLKSLLGEGNFGQVWKAEADDLSGHFGATRIVAVKTIRACSAQLSLRDEAAIMRKLGSHPNVVTLLGACVESDPHMLIMEYAMRGRLLSLLRAARNATNILPASVPGGRSLVPLSPRTLARFALDIACGMEYIAGRNIVHRDLAARNVLLDHNGVCKICDFGMSIDLDIERKRKEQEKNSTNDCNRKNNTTQSKFKKFDFGSRFIIQHLQHNFGQSIGSSQQVTEKKMQPHGHDTISRRPALPIRWMAPEALQYHVFTTETDIWAFGIVLWEIATLGSTPYSQITGREVIRRVPNGLRPEFPKEGRYEFSNLMSRCWNKDPHMRPSFTQARLEIARSLHKWVDDDTTTSDYMDVSGFSEDLEHGVVYFNHRISEFECEI